MTVIVVLLLGVALGVLAGWLVSAGRSRADGAQLVAQHESLLRERDAVGRERDAVRIEYDALAAEVRAAESEVARLAATLQSERHATAERLDQLTESHLEEQQRALEQFRSVSSKVLDESSRRFLQLADERFKAAQVRASGELDQRKQAMEHLVEPIKESLGKVSDQLTSVEKERVQTHAELRQQIETMGKGADQLRLETTALVNALRRPQVRGRWGEMQLRNIIENAGMVEHCDFDEQASVRTADGGLRPDLVVRLAGGKRIVVDSKVSFNGYLEAMEARDDATRAERLTAHARHLKKHVDDLGSKQYWAHFAPTPEFVVMFVPADVFLNAALEQDPTLLEHAFGQQVVIATPSTLIALLRTIAYTWRQEALAKNAQDVLGLGKELYGRLATMGNHLSKLGKSLTGSVKAYNDTVSSMESRVLVTARRMVDLKVVDTELVGAEQLEQVTRQVQAPELVASASEALVALPEPAHTLELTDLFDWTERTERADRAEVARPRKDNGESAHRVS